VIPEPVLDGRRVESLVAELHRYALHYTPDLNLTDEQSPGPALMRIFAHLAETVLVRLGRTPHKHFVAFLDRLGIGLLPARPARAAVTFRLATGLNTAVEVPAGARVTAAGADDDIPFETTGGLIAIPAALTAAFGADPANDTIYAPPPGFLAQEIRPPSELSYTVQSFAMSGAKRLQLDHVTELTPGAFLRIGGTARAVVGKLADGNIVTLKDPLDADVEAQTVVTPIRDFEVFDGIDVQEHVLYLGHADLFTVKQEVAITLDVRLAADPAAAPLTPFGVTWQFWTKVEDDSPDSEEHWHPLTLGSDTTAGFSSNGLIVLTKPKDLEIKEREVGGVKSRWIRAKLVGKLPADGGALPEIDTIEIAVTSVQSDPDEEPGIPADQGFHNATPLDIGVNPDVGFFPFGLEPRQFDQFYVASKEAFSKREATVTLTFKLDLQTLARPAAVMTKTGPRAYSIGLRRRLYELAFPGGQWQLFGAPGTDLPKGAGFFPVEDAVPCAVTDSNGDLIFVFVRTEDTFAADSATRANKIWVHHHRSDGSGRQWVDLDAPGTGPKQIKLNPAAVVLPAGSSVFARVFVVGGDDKLYSLDISSAPASIGGWQVHNAPTGEPWKSSPFAVMDGLDTLVFITGSDGCVHRLALTSGTWTRLAPSTPTFTAVSRPFAQTVGAPTHAKVFVFGRDAGNGKLFECDTRVALFPWNDLGWGGPNVDIGADSDSEAHAPSGFLEDASAAAATVEGKHIFVRGADNRLYERLDAEITPNSGDEWQDRTRLGDPFLRDSPAVCVDVRVGVVAIHVVSASGRNSLVTWEFEIIGGTVAADARQLAVLISGSGNPSTGQPMQVTDNALDDESPNVTAYDGGLRLARFQIGLTFFPFIFGSNYDCLVGTNSIGSVANGTEDLFALHLPIADGRLARLISLRLAGNPVSPAFRSRLTGVVSIAPADYPASGDSFALYAELDLVQPEFLSTDDASTVPALSWEYWNGHGWLSLAVADGTRNLLANGDAVFEVPKSIESTEVAGQENFWIRVRLVGGDYGRETFSVDKITGKVISEKSTLRPPKVRSLRIRYQSPPVPPGTCLTFNNLDYLDQTAACQLGGARFRPFEPLERYPDRSLTLYLGFDKPFKTGPVRLLVDAAEREFDESRPPELDWRFRKDRHWKELDAEDGTVALTRQGLLTLSASEELTREARFGLPLYWIRGSLRTDRGSAGADYRPLLRGIFLNTVWAVQGETITEEIVGSSDGEPNQRHKLMHADVLDGEDVRVREALSAEEQERIEREDGKDAVVAREDLGGTWVRWRETLALFDAGKDDRVYLIDRAAGRLQFGDGIHGRIPPAGIDNIRAFRYRTGGGAIGNVPAGKIEALGTAVAGVESVFNPTPAGGGSDKATTEDMLKIGPRRISHRDRAVSAEDFEELAQEASRQVAKVRCLGVTNLARLGTGRPDPCDETQRHQALPALGWVSLIVVPESPDPHPCPSLELRRTVKDFLRRRAPSVLAASDRIVVRPPDYVVVGVTADLYVTSLEQAAAVETQARKALEKFLHPLRGGADGTGWEFGRPLWKSDVFSVLERIDLIDRVESLQFLFRGRADPDRVVIGPNELIASGQHQLAVKKA
jgi:baseplate J-like protein